MTNYYLRKNWLNFSNTIYDIDEKLQSDQENYLKTRIKCLNIRYSNDWFNNLINLVFDIYVNISKFMGHVNENLIYFFKIEKKIENCIFIIYWNHCIFYVIQQEFIPKCTIIFIKIIIFTKI